MQFSEDGEDDDVELEFRPCRFGEVLSLGQAAAATAAAVTRSFGVQFCMHRVIWGAELLLVFLSKYLRIFAYILRPHGNMSYRET